MIAIIVSASTSTFASTPASVKSEAKEPDKGGGEDETTGQGEHIAGTVELEDIVELAGEYELYFFS